ncbi:MAG: HAMP domain-containing histidine kinase [Defluviitaleaceae bacterium]|nr:HAMP domain-containing histidine kinase [Defluviitaleaceae bacterium]
MSNVKIVLGKHVLSAIIFLLLVTALFASVVVLTTTETRRITNHDQLIDFDFSTDIARISPALFDWHPNMLYNPDDFENGNTTEAIISQPRQSSFATYRLVLNLTEGTVYGIAGYSARYAMTLWVDGAILELVGVVGESRESMMADRQYFTAFFTAGAQPTEIIIQRSGFVRAEGGGLSSILISERPLITAMNTLNHIRISISIGVSLMAALLFFGVFLFFRGRIYFLWFSLVCLMITLRSIEFDYRLINTLFPNISFFHTAVVETASTVGFLFFIILYVDAIFRDGINKIIKVGSLGFLVTYITYSFIMPYISADFHFNALVVIRDFSNGFIVLSMTAILINMAAIIFKNPEMRHIEYVLVLVGSVANLLLGAADAFLRIPGHVNINLNLVQVGALVFVFINIVALAINFRRTESELILSQDAEQRLTAENIALDSLSRMKTEYLANMSHETKAPLTLISVHVQRAAELFEELRIGENSGGELTSKSEKIGDSLKRAQEEVKRAAQLAEKALRLASLQESLEQMKPLDISGLLTDIAEGYHPILEQRGNHIILDISADMQRVVGNIGQLVQVMANLLTNANTHTEKGVITISAEHKGDNIIVVVKDTGSGVNPELMPRIFERGVTGGTGTGVGLAIAKDIIEAHGGTIEIGTDEKGSDETGTTVSFTLPVFYKTGG